MKNKSYMSRYYLFQLGQIKTCTVFSVIFAVLGPPIMMIATDLAKETKNDAISMPLILIAVISCIGMALLSYITPVAVFKNLYRKESADNILSLPLTATRRFFGDMGALFTSYYIPLAFSFLASAIISRMTDSDIYAEVFFYLFLAAVMTAFFNTAVITCCGRLAECIIYPIILNVAIPFIFLYGVELSCVGAEGIVYSGYNIAICTPLMSATPLGIIITLASNVIFGAANIITAIIMSGVYLLLGYISYRKRPAENIGKPFVYRNVFTVLSVIISAAIMITCFSVSREVTPKLALPLAVAIFILMLIMEFISAKKVKSMMKLIIRWSATVLGGYLLCTGLLYSRGFGAGYYVPKASEVEAVSFGTNYMNFFSDGGNQTVFNSVTVSDREIIELVTGEHSYIIEQIKDKDFKEPQASVREISDNESLHLTEASRTFSVSYYMDNGRTIQRYYDEINHSDDFWKMVFDSDGYAINELSDIERIEASFYDNAVLVYNYSVDTVNGVGIRNPHNPDVKTELKIPEEDIDEIISAMKKDLAADTDYGRKGKVPLCIVSIGNWKSSPDDSGEETFYSHGSFTLYEDYVNTIEILSRYFTLPTVQETRDESILNCGFFTMFRYKIPNYGQAYTHTGSDEDFTECVVISAEEFMELQKNIVVYNYDTGDDGYVYHITRGINYYMEAADKEKIIAAAEQAGLSPEDYDFITDEYIPAPYSLCQYMLNSDYNADYRAIFESRTIIKK